VAAFLADQRQVEHLLKDALRLGMVAQMDETDGVVVQRDEIVEGTGAAMAAKDVDGLFEEVARLGVAALVLGKAGQLDEHQSAAMILGMKAPGSLQRLLERLLRLGGVA